MRILIFIALISFLSSELKAFDSDKLKLEELLTINNRILLSSASDTLNTNYILDPNPLSNSIQIEKWKGSSKEQSDIIQIQNLHYIHSVILDDELFILGNSANELIFTKAFSNLRTSLSDNFYFNPESSIKILKGDRIGILIDKELFILDSNLKIIKQYPKVIDFTISSDESISYLLDGENDIQLNINYDFVNSVLRLDPSPNSYLSSYGDSLIVLNEFNDNSLLSIIHKTDGIVFKEWINTKQEMIFLHEIENQLHIIYAKNNKIQLKNISGIIGESSIDLDYEIEFMHVSDDYIIISNGLELVVYNFEGDLLLRSKLSFKKSDHSKIQTLSNNIFHLSNDKKNVIISLSKNSKWFINYMIANYLNIVLYSILGFVFIYLIRLIRIKNSLLRTLIDLPSSGIVIRLARSGDLLTINDLGRKFLNMGNNIPLGQYFDSYLNGEEYLEMREFIVKALRIKEDFSQKITLVYNRNVYEFFCTIICVRNTAGFFEGIILTAVDITEELERKRMANWAQLAHDMQTNLATIILNAEQLELTEDSQNHSRRKKIVHQVNLLINKVRDIVTVGRSNKIHKMNYNSVEIVSELVGEFDIDLHNNIELHSEIDNFQISCDKLKLIRAMRNAVENAIKSMGESKGQITVKAYKDNRFAYFSVSDDGRGMDERTRTNMLNPFFTTGKDKGGSGIGSMIMQNVAEQHGGELLVKSELSKGTEVIFKIPYYRH